MKIPSITVAILTGITSTQALLSPCPNIPAPLYQYNTAPGWSYIKVVDGLHSPRDLVVDSQGRLLIIEKGLGLSQHTVNSAGCIINSRLLISNPDLNHGVCLSGDGKTLYVSSPSTVFGWTYNPATGDIDQGPDIVISGMATSGHTSRTLIIPPHRPDLLVVSHGSNGNIDIEAGDPNTARAIVKVFSVASLPLGGYNFVSQGWNAGFGLRNEVGLAFDGNNMLWGVENSADNLMRTTNNTTTDIHTDNPAEELNFLGDITRPNNAWYGYPTCFTIWSPEALTANNNNNNNRNNATTFEVGQQFVQAPNATTNDSTCARLSVAPVLGLQPHTAPLGSVFDAPRFAALFVALHGSWDRDPPAGYKVVSIPFARGHDGSFAPTASSESQKGSVDVFYPPDETVCSSEACIRPVGLAFDRLGRLYVSSDSSGELFLLSRE